MEENYVIGTCQTMCPKEEANVRQKERLLHVFEIKNGTENENTPKYDPKKIVKCFKRSAAGMQTTNASNLRPFPVLMQTIQHLFTEVFPLHKKKPLVVYDFMFDRLRAVKQDAIIQNLPQAEMIQILEPIARFHIYFGYFLIEKSISDFDLYINNNHLIECIKSLLVCYNECDDFSDGNRWEMESAYLLYNLGNIKALARGTKNTEITTSETYKYCLELSLQWYLKNYVRVCEMITKLSPLLLCVVNFSISEVRKHALHAMSCAYSCANSAYPVAHLKNILLYENQTQVIDDCKYFNIKIASSKINFLKKDFNLGVACNKGVRFVWVDEILDNCDLVSLLYSGKS